MLWRNVAPKLVCPYRYQ